ncbi:M48 family metallopeptidase [Emticicia soli]|uniref:M48 family metallopeptidase n=1 Tax=Emticicia soli TaxID=2027878 RepID=A0ABW5JDJ2_9BACT
MQHEATYYDGQTSQPRKAQVEVFGNSLSIYHEGQKVVWAISEIDYSPFKGKGKVMLQYGTFPHQYLEYQHDSPLAQVLQGYLPKAHSKVETMAREYNAIIRGALIGVAIFSVIASIVYFVLLPSLASYMLSKIPVSTEIAIGDKFFESFIRNAEVDKEKSKVLNDFASKIDFQTEYPLKFTVVKDKQVNAFALPGGNIVVYSGILDKMKSAEELAALLSHEATHVKERHSLQGLSRNLAGSVLISLVFGDTGSISSVLASKAEDLYQLGFSRSMEKEADLKGLQLMYHNRLDPQGMVYLMERLNEEEKKQGSTKMLSYLNSHPMTDERLAYIKEHSRKRSGISNDNLDNIWKELKETSIKDY